MANTPEECASKLAGIERRLQSLEDELIINRIIMTHPPAADSADSEFWQLILGDDGRVDYVRDPARAAGDLRGLVTADQLAATTNTPEFREAQLSGLAHVSSAPIVVLAGDRAEAWNYHQTLIRTEDGFRVFRVFANYWEFSRSAQGWHVATRKVRLMDGDEEAIDILRGAASASMTLMGSAAEA